MIPKKYSEYIYRTIPFAIIIVLFFIYWYWMGTKFHLDNEKSAFGEMFGALNALFAGLAFAGLLITIYYQAKQIAQNKKDSEKQNFESGLFNLLEAQRQIIEQLSYKNYINKEYYGREIFVSIERDIGFLYEIFSDLDSIGPINEKHKNGQQLLFLFTDKYVHNYWPKNFGNGNHREKTAFAIEMLKKKNLKNEFEKLKQIYLVIFYNYHRQIGHYFRHLYHILKYIADNEKYSSVKAEKESDKKDVERNFKVYADIVQSELSSAELFVLFFNGLCFKNMKELIYKYKFLENLAIDYLIKKNHSRMYNGDTISGIKYDAILFKSLDDLVS